MAAGGAARRRAKPRRPQPKPPSADPGLPPELFDAQRAVKAESLASDPAGALEELDAEAAEELAEAYLPPGLAEEEIPAAEAVPEFGRRFPPLAGISLGAIAAGLPPTAGEFAWARARLDRAGEVSAAQAPAELLLALAGGSDESGAHPGLQAALARGDRPEEARLLGRAVRGLRVAHSLLTEVNESWLDDLRQELGAGQEGLRNVQGVLDEAEYLVLQGLQRLGAKNPHQQAVLLAAFAEDDGSGRPGPRAREILAGWAAEVFDEDQRALAKELRRFGEGAVLSRLAARRLLAELGDYLAGVEGRVRLQVESRRWQPPPRFTAARHPGLFPQESCYLGGGVPAETLPVEKISVGDEEFDLALIEESLDRAEGAAAPAAQARHYLAAALGAVDEQGRQRHGYSAILRRGGVALGPEAFLWVRGRLQATLRAAAAALQVVAAELKKRMAAYLQRARPEEDARRREENAGAYLGRLARGVFLDLAGEPPPEGEAQEPGAFTGEDHLFRWLDLLLRDEEREVGQAVQALEKNRRDWDAALKRAAALRRELEEVAEQLTRKEDFYLKVKAGEAPAQAPRPGQAPAPASHRLKRLANQKKQLEAQKKEKAQAAARLEKQVAELAAAEPRLTAAHAALVEEFRQVDARFAARLKRLAVQPAYRLDEWRLLEHFLGRDRGYYLRYLVALRIIEHFDGEATRELQLVEDALQAERETGHSWGVEVDCGEDLYYPGLDQEVAELFGRWRSEREAQEEAASPRLSRRRRRERLAGKAGAKRAPDAGWRRLMQEVARFQAKAAGTLRATAQQVEVFFERRLPLRQVVILPPVPEAPHALCHRGEGQFEYGHYEAGRLFVGYGLVKRVWDLPEAACAEVLQRLFAYLVLASLFHRQYLFHGPAGAGEGLIDVADRLWGRHLRVLVDLAVDRQIEEDIAQARAEEAGLRARVARLAADREATAQDLLRLGRRLLRTVRGRQVTALVLRHEGQVAPLARALADLLLDSRAETPEEREKRLAARREEIGRDAAAARAEAERRLAQETGELENKLRLVRERLSEELQEKKLREEIVPTTEERESLRLRLKGIAQKTEDEIRSIHQRYGHDLMPEVIADKIRTAERWEKKEKDTARAEAEAAVRARFAGQQAQREAELAARLAAEADPGRREGLEREGRAALMAAEEAFYPALRALREQARRKISRLELALQEARARLPERLREIEEKRAAALARVDEVASGPVPLLEALLAEVRREDEARAGAMRREAAGKLRALAARLPGEFAPSEGLPVRFLLPVQREPQPDAPQAKR